MSETLQTMKDLVQILNEAAKAYYQENREIMPNVEYDRQYDLLVAMEKETGIVLSNSPTIHVGYELLSDLPKEEHETQMLSLDKTKDVDSLAQWIGSQKGILSWKLDGLTIVLSYSNGVLIKAVTRGNGEVGEVVTNNAKVFANLPIRISYQGDLVLRGEAVIRYSDFYRMNEEIQDVELKYKNPRNLCSGSVRQLNNRVTAERKVNFFGFSIVKAEGVEFQNSRENQILWLKQQGFETVAYRMTDSNRIKADVEWFGNQIEENDFPSDGLVLTLDDIEYGKSLGATAKFPRDSIAFKWKDEMKETELLEVLWSASRTGLINPIAVFEPVELEGTTVSRASVHNLSILESLALGIGDQIVVYKANMIIPQISENLTKSGNLIIPEHCTVCGAQTVIKQENDVKSLYCPNPECQAKHVKSFAHFVSRDAMGIDGLSEATVEKLIGNGIVRDFADIFHLAQYKEQIVAMEGFGEKSYQNMMDSIEKARKTNCVRFLYSLGIPNVGLSNTKNICKAFDFQWDELERATKDDLLRINGIGEIMANGYVSYFGSEKNKKVVRALREELVLEESAAPSGERGTTLDGLTFVITGSVVQFKNRNEIKELIELNGGKTTDSVTNKTNYLINNDIQSNSSKNKKAKELGIPIISEEQFIDLFLQ